jgi:iron(III) transport system substrate-binding protein
MERLSMGFAVAIALFLGACKEPATAPPKEAEVQLASDLDAAMIDTALKQIERNGGPRAQLIAGQHAGVSVLPGPAGAPVAGAAATPPPAAPARGDVRWDAEPFGAIAASAKGEILPAPQSGSDVPPLWKDPGGKWVAVGGRAAVLLVAVDELGDHGAPVRFTALTEPWLKGKVAIVAPTGGMSLAHFAALYHVWGGERMEAWLAGLKNNQVQLLDTDDDVRRAIVSGKAIAGILSSDEAAKAAASAAHVLLVYPNQRSIGTFVWPTALAVMKNAKNPEAAKQLAEKLADRGTEQLLVARVPGYLPLRPDIPVPPGVRSASNLVVVSPDPSVIVDEIGRRKASLTAWSETVRAARSDVAKK